MARGTYRTGLMVGFERGHVDYLTGQRQEPSMLWVPEGTSEEYRQGLMAGYLKGITGETIPDEQLGR